MRGFLVFFAGCTTVAGLSLIDPNTARWYALAGLGLLYVVSVVHRRPTQPSRQWRKSRVRGDGSGF